MSSSEENDSEDEVIDPDEEILRQAQEIINGLLPEKSAETYRTTYSHFITWVNSRQVVNITENVLLVYFYELSTKYKPPTLWTKWSMIKKCLSMKENINIDEFKRLKGFLTKRSKGYNPNKATTFTGSQIWEFVETAPDDKYLLTKVRIQISLRSEKSRFCA